VDPISSTTRAVLVIGYSAVSVFLLRSSYHSERLLLLLRLWACGERPCVVHHVHTLLAEPAARGVAPDRHRRAVAERLVRAPSVVEGNHDAIPAYASRPSA
jgi:hypothetical protein